MDCSPLGSSVHGISQARILEWVAISFSRRSSQPRDQVQVSHNAGRCFTIWAAREALTSGNWNTKHWELTIGRDHRRSGQAAVSQLQVVVNHGMLDTTHDTGMCAHLPPLCPDLHQIHFLIKYNWSHIKIYNDLVGISDSAWYKY